MENNKRKQTKRLKRNELIAQRERQKLKHKLNKELRKERKLNQTKEKINSKKNNTEEQTPISSSSDLFNRTKKKEAKLSSYKKSQLEYEKKKEEKQKRIEEAKKRQEEKAQALKKYKQNKKHRFKNLCKKSKNGQILMGRQVDSLLAKIEKNNKN